MLSIDLSGRKAFVTGGARGIGAGICDALAKGGADVCFTYHSNQSAAKGKITDLENEGAKCMAFQADAVSEQAMASAVEQAAGYMGGIDILVVNVGKNWEAPVAKLSFDDWKNGIEINLHSVYLAIKQAYPFLEAADRGDIILVGSSGVYDGGGGAPFYAAAKAGMVGLMRYLMRETPQKNIRVNTIHPCVVDTDLLRSRYDTPQKIESLAAQVPLGRLSTPADLGNLAAFLCSDLGSFITGQSILVDGGRTIWKKR